MREIILLRCHNASAAIADPGKAADALDWPTAMHVIHTAPSRLSIHTACY